MGCQHVERTAPSPSRGEHQIAPGTYVISEIARGTGGSGHDCQKEHEECFDRCWNDPNPPYPHKENLGWYHEYCVTKCRKEFNECLDEEERAEKERIRSRPPLRFSDIDTALAWLRSHESELAIGTFVVVAGTTFIIATGGSGALLLAPLAL